MCPMDEETVSAYDSAARSFAGRYDGVGSPFTKYLRLAFPEGSHVLDIGAGSGRDVAAMVADGFAAYGIEPADSLRRVAIERHPELSQRLLAGSLPDDLPADREFDGVLCSAVLQHLPRRLLFDAVFGIKGLLRQHGRALISIPQTSPLVDDTSRAEDGRLFNGVTADELSLLFERIGFQTIGRWDGEDALGRAERRWVTLLFELRSGVDRPLHLVEGVLSPQERKVATYKFALLRAFCDMAMTEDHVVSWESSSTVGVPIEYIAQHWVLYYWPLFEWQRTRGLFIPQMSGESSAHEHRVGFARELHALMALYCDRGSLDGYILQAKAGSFGARERQAHDALIKKLKHVIQRGPVKYAGGALASGRMFGFRRGHVLVAADLWRELSLTGHWVRDALLLRWAQLCSRLSKGELTAEQAIGPLLVEPSTERMTADARALYDAVPDLRCTWTDQLLRPKTYHADHVIPFSLWRNNDIWNLLPVSASANLKKSDKLPTRRLLNRRRPRILYYWNEARTRYPKRFDREARTQTGESQPRLDTLFERLLESVEITSLQRACQRWEPA